MSKLLVNQEKSVFGKENQEKDKSKQSPNNACNKYIMLTTYIWVHGERKGVAWSLLGTRRMEGEM